MSLKTKNTSSIKKEKPKSNTKFEVFIFICNVFIYIIIINFFIIFNIFSISSYLIILQLPFGFLIIWIPNIFYVGPGILIFHLILYYKLREIKNNKIKNKEKVYNGQNQISLIKIKRFFHYDFDIDSLEKHFKSFFNRPIKIKNLRFFQFHC